MPQNVSQKELLFFIGSSLVVALRVYSSGECCGHGVEGSLPIFQEALGNISFSDFAFRTQCDAWLFSCKFPFERSETACS